ncbi:MAG: hypothetical protein IKJ61_07200 [Bacteroidaceae bacterium]|nr:hypothetical protein [Bacteroidaceae bacterium]
MKTLKYSFGLLFSLIAMITISSCEEFPTVTQEFLNGEVVDTDPKLYFSNKNAAQIDLTTESKSFDVEISRTVAADAATYAIKVTADEVANTAFEFPETVEFADSATTAIYTVTIKEGTEFEYDVFHNITLSVDESMSTPYGNATYSFKVGIPAPWSEWAPIEGHETGTYYMSLYTSLEFPDTVFYREHMLDETKAQFMFRFTLIGAKEDLIVDYNKETNECQVGIHDFIDNANYGPVFVSDFPHNPFDLNGDGLRETYEDNPCTFDPETGTLTLNLVYFVYTGLGSSASGTFGTGEETAVLDGFKKYDYTFSMNFLGHYIDNNGVDNAVISATKGADVTKYLMTVVGEGADLNATLSGMLDGSVPCDTLTESGFMAYPITESGVYTALAVTFDANEEVLEAYAENFEFYLAGQENPWKSLGYAEYTDDIILPLYGNSPMSYYVEVLESKDQPGLFRLVDLCGPEYPFYPYGTYEEGNYIEIDATDPTAVWIAGWQNTGFDLGNGVIEITSMAWYQVSNTEGATKEDAKEAGLCGIYADGVITFPVDGIVVGMGENAYKANRNGAFKLDMTNMIESLPEESAAAKVAVRGNYSLELNENAATGFKCGIRAKKIDKQIFTPAELAF